MFQITPGKLKGLQAVSDAKGVIRAAAMDQRGSLRKSIAKERGVDPKQVTDQEMAEFKTLVSRVLTPYASAILLDPEFGLPAVKARHKKAGVLLAYEQTGYDHTLPGRVPTLIPYWTARKTLEAGGDCVKVLLYYSPDEDHDVNEIKHAFIERIGAECADQDAAFFLEFVGYDPNGGDEKGLEFSKQKPRIVIESMKEFSKPRYQVDVLKVEIPVNSMHVEGTRAFRNQGVAQTRKQALEVYREAAAVAKKPFIYLSAGVSDDQFRENLELAGEAGVQFAGVLCGRATWKDGIPHYAKSGAAAFEKWLKDRGVRNIQALNKILDRTAHPWFVKYGGMSKVQVVDRSGKPLKQKARLALAR